MRRKVLKHLSIKATYSNGGAQPREQEVTAFYIHPDWLIRSNFRLRRSEHLHKLVDISTSKNEFA